MIQRDAKDKLKNLAAKFKAVAVIGPRQTGKTTLVKQVFKTKPYVSLENPDFRNFALEDPRGFLANYPKGAILDEVQRVPEIFSYLQEILDNSKVKGLFVLSGSNNFLFQQSISQSLAGRVGYLQLLPFSLSEMKKGKILLPEDDQLMLNGFYPPVYDQKIPPADWCANYIRTYIEKDVRQIKNITDLITFEKFISLLAGRNGQELNSSSLAVETGVDLKTIQSWIGILESSFIIYLLRPHHANYNKTIVKRPKIYFYDTSLVCYLLGIRSISHLKTHPARGAIFESMVVTELVKKRTNKGLPVNLFYWRDKTGHEIDVIIDYDGNLLPVEIKSGMTFREEFFKNLDYWTALSKAKKSVVLYAGENNQKRSNGKEIICWRELVKKDL
ncbi:MAG: ATP-binding protein [Crocinitomicaceae bacterium]|nr:ATP-binding protein [Crocinitomicaceae bacterium]